MVLYTVRLLKTVKGFQQENKKIPHVNLFSLSTSDARSTTPQQTGRYPQKWVS